ncbi:MAG: 1,4-dihydroxy-2-naphthoate octaprenyltransferase [Chromatiaceae bacterium]|nr:1,4-dihydroxy-2-naphthoate octaprenyltransferase [Chromatiaceae bacterium]
MPAPTVNLARWIAAGRPRTLPLAVAPVLAGIALAAFVTDGLELPTALATLLAAVAIQVGTNLHNDAADFERGTDTQDRVGPERAAAQGWFTAAQVRRAAHLAFLTALLFGVLLTLRGGWPILLLGLAALAAGYAYTGGPRPIAYGPFGELFVLIFFGIAAVTGSHYLQTLAFSPTALGLGVALGLPAAAVLTLNSYRDRETDLRAGRRTLCHYLGPGRSQLLYALLLLAPFPLLYLLDLPGRLWPVLAALPLSAWLIIRLFRGQEGSALNALLGATALYQSALAVLLIIGFALPTA